MKEIALTNALVALVDDEDFERLSQYKWRPLPGKHVGYYAATEGDIDPVRRKRRTLLMHRLVLNAAPGITVDHINGNKLDNRKENLRLATFKQQQGNRRRKDGGRYTGVTKHGRRFRADCNGYIGVYSTEEEAARAYDTAARAYFGEFARLNFKEGE